MDSASIEAMLASSICRKRRKTNQTESGQMTTRLIDGDEEEDDGDSDAYNDLILDLTGRRDFGSEECCSVLANMLASTEHAVTKLLLARVGIGPKGGMVLAGPLATNPTIVHLDLERNGLGAVGACAIFRALATNTSLLSLNASLNDVKAATTAGNDEATKALGEALRRNSNLRELFIVRSGLGPKGGNNLADGLASNTSLLRLDMEGNDIMADGGRSLGEALATNSTLRNLNLRWNRIGCGGDRGILALANALNVNVGLLQLDVSVNELYCEGATAFGRALAKNHTLLDLSLERNEIGTQGAIALADALKSNSTLERLVLSGNPGMGDAGAAAIGQALAVDHRESSSALRTLELVGCGVGIEGARALGQALQSPQTSLWSLRLEKNRIGPEGAAALASGLARNTSLRQLNLSRNNLQGSGGSALATALLTNKTLLSLNLSSNDIDIEAGSCHIVESIVDHPSLEDADVSSNALEIVPIDCQLRLAKLYQEGREIRLDLCDNPLSSPPLGRKAYTDGLRAYLTMLLSESTVVTRIRLMVLGFGGVGKSTFCDAVTQPLDALPHFHGSLIPLQEWNVRMIASWARRLGTHWAPWIGYILEKNHISGMDLPQLTVLDKPTDGLETYEPSDRLHQLVNTNTVADGAAMSPSETKSFARAIGALVRKGYFSTVGAVKLDGLLELDPGRASDSTDSPRRKCSLVDFAGQMEYLVSHQLLLSSLHTLCVVLQPAPSFGNPNSRHYGSWRYWSRFLRALGDRRQGSLLLAISQQDRVTNNKALESEVSDAIENELDAIRASIPNISDAPPLCLDYRPERIRATVEQVRAALSAAADVVARDWWVPASYEKLAELVRQLEATKKARREVPIVSRTELRDALPSVGLHRMQKDPQLFQRGIDYLEAVGDVMADHRLDCLLLDPISWFASFLAHFIRDDDIVTSVQLDSRFVKRGVVGLEDVVAALKHDYAKPREQVAQIMSLVCGLELCIRCDDETNDSKEFKTDPPAAKADKNGNGGGSSNHETIAEEIHVSYLFPCLLPAATPSELARHWPVAHKAAAAAHQLPAPLAYRGHRFRSRNGFFPPGLFPGLLARCRLLRSGILSPERMWKNCAVLVFGRATRVLLRIDACEGDGAVLDVVGAAPTTEDLFVGGAKGQASVVIWMTHLVKMFLRRAYPQLETDEYFLCPSAECHSAEVDENDTEFYPCRSSFKGTEFSAVPQSGKRYKGDHSCEADGCWGQLGVGHKIERMKPICAATEHALFCTTCRREARFALRT